MDDFSKLFNSFMICWAKWINALWRLVIQFVSSKCCLHLWIGRKHAIYQTWHLWSPCKIPWRVRS